MPCAVSTLRQLLLKSTAFDLSGTGLSFPFEYLDDLRHTPARYFATEQDGLIQYMLLRYCLFRPASPIAFGFQSVKPVLRILRQISSQSAV